jgi:high-affinity nickel permease
VEIELQKLLVENWPFLLICGFLFGIGFEFGSQIVWFVCDWFKNLFSIPLG